MNDCVWIRRFSNDVSLLTFDCPLWRIRTSTPISPCNVCTSHLAPYAVPSTWRGPGCVCTLNWRLSWKDKPDLKTKHSKSIQSEAAQSQLVCLLCNTCTCHWPTWDRFGAWWLRSKGHVNELIRMDRGNRLRELESSCRNRPSLLFNSSIFSQFWIFKNWLKFFSRNSESQRKRHTKLLRR